MKKLLSLFLVLMLLSSLVACSGTTIGSSTPDVLNDGSSGNLESSENENEEASSEDSGTIDEELNSDFKTAMDKYEDFMDDYISFMKKYKANPSDLSLLSDYSKYMSDYVTFVDEFNGWENKDLNASELAYYVEVQTRVSKKLLDVAQ